MTTKVIISVIVLATSYGFGRWSAPEKIKIEKQIVEVEKKTSDSSSETDRNRHRETTETEVTKPDGTVEKTKKTVEDSSSNKETNKHDTAESTITESESKEITRPSSKVTISALAGAQLSLSDESPLHYGVAASKPILGPLTMGVFFLTPNIVGGMLGLTF